jgi:hypothetical protein
MELWLGISSQGWCAVRSCTRYRSYPGVRQSRHTRPKIFGVRPERGSLDRRQSKQRPGCIFVRAVSVSHPPSQSRPAWMSAPPTKPSASITAPVSARHSQVRRVMIGCGTASVRAPPASGKPSASNRPPSSARRAAAQTLDDRVVLLAVHERHGSTDVAAATKRRKKHSA